MIMPSRHSGRRYSGLPFEGGFDDAAVALSACDDGTEDEAAAPADSDVDGSPTLAIPFSISTVVCGAAAIAFSSSARVPPDVLEDVAAAMLFNILGRTSSRSNAKRYHPRRPSEMTRRA